MAQKAGAPIGIFDSGIGGLTVAQAVRNRLPGESIIYFGDTAHLPYGDKSPAAIQAYSIKICDVLLKNGCKLILIACNSASSVAYDLVREYVGSKARVMNVIDPVIDHMRENFAHHTVGLIGTKQTVNANVYKKKTDDLDAGISLQSLATPLLVPMIEEGYFKNEISMQIISNYLENPVLDNIAALILGCTHYPLIKNQIGEYYKHQNREVAILDSSEIVAEALHGYLSFNNLLNKEGVTRDRFLVSDYTHSFEASTKLFFKEEVELESYPLWE